MASAPVTACDPPRHLARQGTLVSGLRGPLSTLTIVVALGACVMVIGRTDAALHRGVAARQPSAELMYLPPTPFLRAVSVGYRQALADVLWFRTISYFGYHYQGDRVYNWLAYMCNVVTDLDPRAEYVYAFGGVMLSWEADRVDDGIALLEKGTRHMPDSWRLHYILGFNYYFFKNDLAAAGRAFEAAVHIPGAPDWLTRMLATMSAAQRGNGDAVAFLTDIERDTTNDEMRSAIHARVLELTLARDIDALEAAVKAFESRFQRKPAELEELVWLGFLTFVPEEPFGGRYLLAPDTGRISSSTGHEPRRLRPSKLREQFLKGNK
jgi:hypothetical protein